MKQENLKRAAEIGERLSVIEIALNHLYQGQELAKNICINVKVDSGIREFYMETTHCDFEKIRKMNIDGFMKERKVLLTELKKL